MDYIVFESLHNALNGWIKAEVFSGRRGADLAFGSKSDLHQRTTESISEGA